MLSAAVLAPARARRRRIIALATSATSVLAAGAYLVDHSATPAEPSLAMLDATELAPHVVVFSAPLSRKDKDPAKETDKKGSGDTDTDRGSSDKGSSASAAGTKSDKKGSGGSSSPTISSPAGSSSQPSPLGWPTGSTTSPSTSDASSPTTSSGSGWGNLAPGSRVAAALPPGIKASVPTSSPPAPASAGSTSQVPCTSRASNMAALQKAVTDAGTGSAVICMNTTDSNNTSAPASAPTSNPLAPSSYSSANTSNTAPPLSAGSSLPASPSVAPSIPSVTSPSGYTAPATPTTTPEQARPAQMLSQIQCPSSMSQGSVCFEAVDSHGAAASLPPASELGHLPVVPSPGSTAVSCPTQLKNNHTSTTRTTRDGTTTIENTTKGSGKTSSSDPKDSDSNTSPDSTVASCGLLSY